MGCRFLLKVIFWGRGVGGKSGTCVGVVVAVQHRQCSFCVCAVGVKLRIIEGV